MSVRPRQFRINVESAASILCDDGTRIPCMVTNISLTGAKIEFSQTAAIPEEFVLLSDELCLKSESWIVWRLGPKAGVRFHQPIAIGSL